MNRLRREGWAERPGRGAHTVFVKPERDIILVPSHRGDLETGTLRSIARAAGWDWPPWG
jgi:predicted RNA binding protein YcfA (HicA-like mRNA interferase family)